VICLCGCGQKPRVRGICDAAYQRYRKLIAARKTTWSELARAGKCLRKRKHGDFGFARSRRSKRSTGAGRASVQNVRTSEDGLNDLNGAKRLNGLNAL